MSAQMVPTVILFAEDDPNDVLLLERILSRFFPACRLQIVADGESAIAYLQGEGPYRDRSRYPFPQLVILDINLPRKSGLEVLAWIREQPRLTGLIVLILTGSESEEHIRQAYDLHVNSFLQKQPLLSLPQASKGCLEYWLSLNQPPGP